jgi:hypothetical protein
MSDIAGRFTERKRKGEWAEVEAKDLEGPVLSAPAMKSLLH